MIFTAASLEGIASGAVTLAFRRWDGPRVRAGSSQRTRIGVVAFDAVDEVSAAEVTDAAAWAAGFPSAAALLSFVDRKAHGPILYRIELRYAGADPRVALRESAELSDTDVTALVRKLARMDANGPWTERTLRLIADRPGVVSTELAAELSMPRAPFKQRVRRLEELGLTESLEVGYRLSPRGETLLGRLPRVDPRGED
ncbi:winged helix-turn-helix domain-containing protein [Rhodococcus sp. NPDC059234]|uniref:winged helix-turn-helix domain-containing protein n=1 Tax=Rhodococcus sp. NPDC059234 TaxID=3346781 RepID=UPI00366F557F